MKWSIISNIKYEINEYNNPDIVIINTPGQMELFAFRNTGPMIANALGYGNAQRGILFCYDSSMSARPNGFISTMLLAASVQYQFENLPQINVLTKKDFLSEEKLERIMEWIEDNDQLDYATESDEKGMVKEITLAWPAHFENSDRFPN